MDQREIKVAALMTAPRYEAVWARNHIERALHKSGIPLTVSGGVFYGQCMQLMMEEAIDNGVEYILTVDFDSVFTEKHVSRLLSIAVHQEHIDAVAAIQPKRGEGTPLASNGRAETIEWSGDPIQVKSAHFGLTVIDAKKLADMAKPWFWGSPNHEGRWDEGKVDDDVSFWARWEHAGNSLYIDPGCRLGHLEEVVTIFDSEMKLKRLYPADWDDYKACSVD